MTLTAGSRLGPYEIVSPLGAGGMGEVYRARDTRLERTVAVKVLPDHLSSPEARQRFEREAKTISQLSHPHICALYDVGHEAGVEYLVMEFLEGETLADRLGRGSLPVEQAVKYGIQMAEALDRAHRAGVIHRDLKPANVMLTKSGAKLLDFGLAKLSEPPGGVVSGLSMQMTTPHGSNLTAAGTILGTFQYMAPEQLEGKEVDARTDIFAFGSVLYEMVTGRKAFAGASQASLIASILERQPEPITSIQPLAPATLDHVVRKCMAKDPDERWQSAADVASELRWASETSAASIPAPRPATETRRRIGVPPVLAGIALVLLGLAAGLALSRVRRASPPVERSVFSILPPEKAELADWVAMSPDGRAVAFPASIDGRTTIWVRSLDSSSARSLSGTEGALFPFWSPDGRSLGFFAGDKLKRIDLAGGPAIVLCDAPAARGGAWGREGTIIFSGQASTGIFQIPASGGSPKPATTVDTAADEITHRWPEFLPDGRHFIYYAYAATRGRIGVYLGELGSTRKDRLLAGGRRASVAPGRLFFAREGTLFAQRFDERQLKPTGDAVPIADHVWFTNEFFGHSSISASQTGTVAFREGSPEKRQTWFDRTGKPLGAVGPARLWDEPALSPDETRVAVDGTNPETNHGTIWALDLVRGTSSPLTPEDIDASDSVWSPDGKSVAYRVNRGGEGEVRIRELASGREVVVMRLDGLPGPVEWSPDGTSLICAQGTTGLRLWIAPVSGGGKPRPLLKEETVLRQIRFSPDGRFFAYVSGESGENEVYLRRFPPTDERWQVSLGGGVEPYWPRDGKEFFYITPDRKMTSVSIRTTPSVEIGKPLPLFAAPTVFGRFTRSTYVVTRDGGRFLFSVPVDQSRPTITLIQNAAPDLSK